MNRRLLHTLARAACVCLVLCCAAHHAQAQTEAEKLSPARSQTASPEPSARTNADETFELNIAERRITRDDYEASTSVEAGEAQARGLALRVGVMVRAGNIDVLLRGVQGSVRFRASLDAVLRRLGTRRNPVAAPAQDNSPAP